MKRFLSLLLVLLGVAPALCHAQMASAPASVSAASLPAGVLHREQAGAILPATVFFKGQTAAIQARNSGGIKFGDGKLLLAGLVDSSGYASSVQEVYQAYLLVETPILFGGQRLPAGAYGFGFLPDSHAVVMDIGGTTLLRVATAHDADLRRPMPLQILDDAAGHGYKLYLGRSYVTITAAQ